MATRMQLDYEHDVRAALATLHDVVDARAVPQERDALYLVESAALALIGRHCPHCEARPGRGDNDYCSVDGSPHAWVATETAVVA